MPIEAKCPGCDRLLRVSDEFAGKQARCPVCNAIYSVPQLPVIAPEPALVAASGGGDVAPETAVIEAEPVPDNSVWFMKTPEGQTFGPAKRAELDKWVTEGRVTSDCELRADEGAWQTADLVYPVLRGPGGNNSPAGANPPGGLVTTVGGNPSYLAPHRGGIVLALGLMGFVSGCPILSIMAWVMGNGDLREMREGRMDPEGQGMTQAGYVLGMILSGFWILAAVIGLFVMLVFVARK